jgi:hypothetical protein
MPDWYYAKAGKQFGPVSPAELRQMAQAGELVPDDLVFQEGGTQWVSASTVKGLFGPGTGVRSNAARGESERPQIDDKGQIDRTARDNAARDESERAALDDRSSGAPGRRSYFVDLLLFRRLIAPTIIQIMFWLGVASVLLSSLMGAIGGLVALVNSSAVQGLLMIFLSLLYIPFGVLVVRLWCEMLILFFRMNETLTDIKDALERNQKKE